MSILHILGAILSGLLLSLSLCYNYLLLGAVILLAVLFYIISVSKRIWLFSVILLFYTSFFLTTYLPFLWHKNSNGLGILFFIIPTLLYTLSSLIVYVNSRYKVELFITSIIVSELFFINFEIGNTINQLGLAFSDFPFIIKTYAFSGVIGGSVLILLLSLILYQFTKTRHTRQIIYCLLIIISPLLLAQFNNNDSDTTIQRVVGAVGLNKGERCIDSILVANNNYSIDYIVCPEATHVFYEDKIIYSSDYTSIKRALTDSLSISTVIMGAYLIDSVRHTNNIVLYLSKKDKSPRVRFKQKLMPYGEYLPWEEYIEYPHFIRSNLPKNVHIRENIYDVMLCDNGDVISPVICYESIFSSFLKDLINMQANIFVNLSSNSNIDSKEIEKRAQKILQCNAATVNRYIIRAVENGISMIINNKGVVVNESKYCNDLIRSQVSLINNITFYCAYNKTSTLFVFLYLFLSLLLLNKIK